MENKVIIDGLRLYAYHGVLEQERKIGAYFTVDAEVVADFSKAMDTDEIDDTVSYADLFDTIRQQMTQPSRLLEHVAGRIARAILRQHRGVKAVSVRITKENPPMGADCRGAGVEVSLP